MTFKELKELRSLYAKTAKDDLLDFDKNFFLVSAGIFAFTVTFIKDIVNIRAAHIVILLFLSWGFLALAIALIILAFFFSSANNLNNANRIDNKVFHLDLNGLNDDALIPPDRYPELHHIRIFSRFLAIISFIAGLIFLSWFLIINFYWGNDEATKDDKKKAEPTLVPSEKNPVAPINYDTTIHIKPSFPIDGTVKTIRIDSSFIILKPDTIFLKATSACSCPPDGRRCSEKCIMKRKR